MHVLHRMMTSEGFAGRSPRVPASARLRSLYGLDVSYRMCYQIDVAKRMKRSVSLAPDLAVAIERAAADRGESFSGWLAATAAHRLRIEAGRRALSAWERAHGALTAAELNEGRARARALLGTHKAERKRKSA